MIFASYSYYGRENFSENTVIPGFGSGCFDINEPTTEEDIEALDDACAKHCQKEYGYAVATVTILWWHRMFEHAPIETSPSPSSPDAEAS